MYVEDRLHIQGIDSSRYLVIIIKMQIMMPKLGIPCIGLSKHHILSTQESAHNFEPNTAFSLLKLLYSINEPKHNNLALAGNANNKHSSSCVLRNLKKCQTVPKRMIIISQFTCYIISYKVLLYIMCFRSLDLNVTKHSRNFKIQKILNISTEFKLHLKF